MNHDSAFAKSNNAIRTTSIPFSDIPGQSRLFLDYQNDATSLRRFYPSAVGNYRELTARIPEVLNNYKTDRTALCDALKEANRSYGAGEQTFENIERLREPDCAAIVTGQQAGLFTGPLYTIYKALSAVKTAESLREEGVNAVPVFWVASEDHDFQEVARTYTLDENAELAEIYATRKLDIENLQVAFSELDESIESTVTQMFGPMQWTDFTGDLSKVVSSTWTDGTAYSDAFAKLLAAILKNTGIIIFDPCVNAIKDLCGPIYAEAVKKSDQIVSALVGRDSELAVAGYHSQVLISEDYFPLFLHSEDHTRHSLRKSGPDTFRAKGKPTEFTREDLMEMASNDPARFSPTVVLRPVVQDRLLPTLCYFGGAAEIAYFAQNSVVYEALGRPVTPILHRQSFTIVPAKHTRTLRKYELEFADLFAGKEKVLEEIAERFLSPEIARTFAEVEERVNIELNRLGQMLSELDPTLAGNLAKRRRKILYHIGALKKKSYRSQVRQDEVVSRRINALFNTLLPYTHLQERSLNVITFLNLYGHYFIDWVYDSIDLDDKGHRLIYL